MGRPKTKPTGRPSVKGRSSKAQKNRRNTVPLREKVDVVAFFNECQDMRATLRRFYSHLSEGAQRSKAKRIYDWCKQYDVLKARNVSEAAGDKRYFRDGNVGTVLTSAMEKAIVAWINEMRKEGIPVTTLMLQLYAQQVTHDNGINEFKGSWSWRKCFLKCHRLSIRARTRQGQVPPEDAARVLHEFAASVTKRMAELGVTKVYNADQTAAMFEYLPKCTISERGTKTVWVRCGGKEKDRATVMLTGDSDGNKYDPFIVYKKQPSKKPDVQAENVKERHGFSDRMWRAEILPAQQRNKVHIYCNATGWWNEDIHIQFLDTIFGPLCTPEKPLLLLVDDFSGHWTDKVLQHAKRISVELMKVPPACTSVCQPADVSWNRPFKTRLRGLWVSSIQQQFSVRPSGTKFKLTPPKRDTMTDWIRSAWDDVSTASIANGFSRLQRSEEPEPIGEDVARLLETSVVVEAAVSEDEDIGAREQGSQEE